MGYQLAKYDCANLQSFSSLTKLLHDPLIKPKALGLIEGIYLLLLILELRTKLLNNIQSNNY